MDLEYYTECMERNIWHYLERVRCPEMRPKPPIKKIVKELKKVHNKLLNKIIVECDKADEYNKQQELLDEKFKISEDFKYVCQKMIHGENGESHLRVTFAKGEITPEEIESLLNRP